MDHHVAILTDDYQKSKKFYTEVLGFETVLSETYQRRKEIVQTGSCDQRALPT